MPMSDAFVAARALTKSFGKKPVLRDVTLEVRPGEVVGVLGKNGAGKTTLLELILGFTRPTSGSVEVFGSESFGLPGAAKERIGFVPQQDELINQLSGANQLKVVGSFYRNWDDSLIRRLSEAWEIELTEPIRQLSVGQRQKLSILTALGHHPDLLILDEPVASLDPLARRQFLQQIIEISADPCRAVIFSSHIVSDVERLANKIWILKDQRLYWSGDIDNLKQSILRIHVRGSDTLPSSLAIPNAISFERQENYATAVVHDWTSEVHEQVVRETGAQLEIEPLGLEEIFLELHR
jgi:ABC-2 type transport system ATP-binding protein